MNTIPWAELNKTLTEKASSEMLPLNGTFELTPLCNFRCKMCYVRLDPSQMTNIGRERTTEEWISLGRQAADMGCLTLLLTGGEPFLRPDFKQIYEALINMGFLVAIFTNAALITPEIVKWLSKIPPKFIRVTLYGASNETYYKVCGVQNGYEQATRGIELLLKAGLPVTMASTLINENESDLDLMSAFAQERRLHLINTACVKPPVRGAQSSAITARLCDEKVHSIAKQMPTYTYDSFCPDVDPMRRCNSSRNSFWVTWDGRMTLCSTTTEPFTYPFISGFETAWHELGTLLRNIKPPSECINCDLKKYCQSCMGLFCSETGSPDKTIDRICSIARARYEFYCEQNKIIKSDLT